MKMIQMKQLVIALLAAMLLVVPAALADWGTCGIPLTTEYNPYSPNVAPDGAGGAYFIWNVQYGPTADLHLKRLDATGKTLWEALVVDDAITVYNDPQIIPDGVGGAIVVWMQVDAAGEFFHLRAQRIDADGSLHSGWTTGGVRLCTSTDSQQYPVIVSDDSGGVIAAWEDGRPTNGVGYNIYAQHVNGSGNIASGWPVEGLEIISAGANTIESPSKPSIAADGMGGAVVSWTHITCPAFDSQLFARRINTYGATIWQKVVSSFDDAYNHQIITSESGGTILTWDDDRNGNLDVFAQKLDSSGNNLWTANGLLVCANSDSQSHPQLTSDGSGGAVITWADDRGYNIGVYGQSVQGNGTLHWAADGKRLALRGTDHQVCSRPDGGALVVWHDNLFPYKLHIQGVDEYGLMIYPDGGQELCDGYQPKIASDGAGGAFYVWQSATISANRLEWALPTTPNQTIVDGSYFAGPGPQKPNYMFDWNFSWKTNGYTDPDLDRVIVGDPKKTSPACAINVNGSPNTLSPDLPGVGMTVKPNLDGTYQHSVVWYNRDCVTPCSYLYSLYSTFNGAMGSVLDRKMLVLYCMSESLPSFPVKSLSGVEMSAPSPNPFNPMTVIRFYVPADADNVSLSIYDLAGHKVKTFGGGISERQWVERTWTGTDDASRRVGSGIYFAILEVDGERFTRKLAMLK